MHDAFETAEGELDYRPCTEHARQAVDLLDQAASHPSSRGCCPIAHGTIDDSDSLSDKMYERWDAETSCVPGVQGRTL